MLSMLRLLMPVWAWCLLAPQAAAQPRAVEPRVLIVSSDSTAAYMEAAQALTAELGRSGLPAHDIRRLSVSEWSLQAEQATSPRVYVALGTLATNALVTKRMSTPVLAALIPRHSFERALGNGARKPGSDFSAIYLDQPLQRQLAMIRLALPQAKRVGVLWGPDSWPRASGLRSVVAASGLSLREAVLETRSNVFPDLQQVLNDSDVFLAIADPLVFNSHSIQNILLTTFRMQVPVVAFSPAYVRAGALLALHATPEQVGRQAAALVLDVLRGQPLPERPVESNDFEVSVNEHVARVFNLSLDGKALRLALRRLEHLP